jgi:DNA-binding protein H-NS
MQEFSDAGLNGLAIDELIRLAERVRQLISRKVANEKKALKEKLSLIEEYEARPREKKQSKAPSGKKTLRRRSKAAPKYRDPASGVTWSGRGMTPRWLAAAIAQGQSREDFLIRAAPPNAQSINGAHAEP